MPEVTISPYGNTDGIRIDTMVNNMTITDSLIEFSLEPCAEFSAITTKQILKQLDCLELPDYPDVDHSYKFSTLVDAACYAGCFVKEVTFNHDDGSIDRLTVSYDCKEPA